MERNSVIRRHRTRQIVPENHGLALTPNTLSVLVAGNVVMFNDGAETQFALPDMRPSEAVAAAGHADGNDDDAALHVTFTRVLRLGAGR